jgi:hypothetical protein
MEPSEKEKEIECTQVSSYQYENRTRFYYPNNCNVRVYKCQNATRILLASTTAQDCTLENINFSVDEDGKKELEFHSIYKSY